MYNPGVLDLMSVAECNQDKTELSGKSFYIEKVLPRLQLPLRDAYPLARLDDAAGYHPLGEHPVLMLVALTGTGKTTALQHLKAKIGDDGMGVIPTRREVADWIAIPMMQVQAGEQLRQISDRVQRFRYTRQFAAQVEGGMAAAFSWLRLADCCRGLVLSEGIRGENELRYALTRYPKWQIVDLTARPLVRLRRLSGRGQNFDQAKDEADLAFLPESLQDEARKLLEAGKISARAVTIMRAEAENYGLLPVAEGAQYAGYHRLVTDELTPAQVAAALHSIMKVAMNAKN